MEKALQSRNLFQVMGMVCHICLIHIVSISIRELYASTGGEHTLIILVSSVIKYHEQSNIQFLFITLCRFLM